MALVKCLHRGGAGIIDRPLDFDRFPKTGFEPSLARAGHVRRHECLRMSDIRKEADSNDLLGLNQ
jgi:hypothetical protein